MLVRRLESMGRDVVGFAEPYHGFVKELLEASPEPWTDVLLFAVDRWLLKTSVASWLSQGKTLVSSRSIYCSLAYQGAQGVGWKDILEANNWRSLCLPDLVLILDVDPEVAYSRCSKEEKFERKPFLAKVREGYLGLVERADELPTQIHLVDASGSLDEVFERAWTLVKGHLESQGDR
jgi:dTMP kinase